jgi:hypothetical protein
MCNNCLDGMYFKCEQKQFDDFLESFVPQASNSKRNHKKRPVLITPAQKGSVTSTPAQAQAQLGQQ